MGSCLQVGHREGASCRHQGCLLQASTRQRQLLHCLLLLLLRLSQVLRLKGLLLLLLLLLQGQRHQLPGAYMRDTCTRRTGSSLPSFLQRSMLLVCALVLDDFVPIQEHGQLTAIPAKMCVLLCLLLCITLSSLKGSMVNYWMPSLLAAE